MLFHLVKKDFLIVKKYVLLMLIVCILIPPFMLWRVPDFAGPMSFCLSVYFQFLCYCNMYHKRKINIRKHLHCCVQAPIPGSCWCYPNMYFA